MKRAPLLLTLLLVSAAFAAPSVALAQDTPDTTASIRAGLEDGLQFHSADDAFQLRLGFAAQARLQAAKTTDDDKLTDITVPLVRPNLRGQLGVPWLTFFVQPELAGSSPKLLDFNVDLTLDPLFNVRVGQFRTPFSRTYITAITNLLFTDRSAADFAFRAGRDTGAMIYGTPLDGVLEYNLGVFNGNGINGKNDDRDFSYIARLAVNPLGRMTYDEIPTLSGSQPLRFGVGVSALRGERTDAATDTNPGGKSTSMALEVDTALKVSVFTLQAEGYARWTDPSLGDSSRALGGYAQAGAFVYGPVEVGARVNYIDPSDAVTDDESTSVEGVANLYSLGNHLKLQARLGLELRQEQKGEVGTLLTQVMF